MKRILLAALAVLLVAGGVWYFLLREPAGIPVYGVAIVGTHPHDPDAFTQGLFIQDGLMYESTGRVGSSWIRATRPGSSEIVRETELPAPYFGEGIVALRDRLYQVTWQDRAGFVYNLADLSPQGNFSYTGEGWGLTHNGSALILSDGTPTLRFLDPETMAVKSTITVTANGCPVEELNELEWVDGEIWANIWQTNLIARIDPATGNVTSFVDISSLGPTQRGMDAVPNGIAYDSGAKRLWMTGKLWPQLYEVRVGDRQPNADAAAALTTCQR